MSFLHIDSVLGAAQPGGGKLHAQSSLRRRAALIRADRATWGKDTTNWEGEGGLGEGSMLGRWLSTWLHFAGCCVWKQQSLPPERETESLLQFLYQPIVKTGDWESGRCWVSPDRKNYNREKTVTSLRHFTELWLKRDFQVLQRHNLSSNVEQVVSIVSIKQLWHEVQSCVCLDWNSKKNCKYTSMCMQLSQGGGVLSGLTSWMTNWPPNTKTFK